MNVTAKPKAKAKGLGRGISALMEEEDMEEVPASNDNKTEMDIDDLQPGKYQPRRSFSDAELHELATSIRRNGLVQPIVVRRVEGGHEIVAGERRWRASRIAGLKAVPVIVRDLTDQQTLEFALIENIQRQDLNPLEEAEGYQRLVDDFGHTQDELAATVGKSRSHVTNMIRLLSLPDEVKDMVSAGDITMGHARAILKTENPAELARTVIQRGLNVRQTENLAKGGEIPPKSTGSASSANSQKSGKAVESHAEKDADIIHLEQRLTEALGLAVSIDADGAEGVISIAYANLEQLDVILQRLGGAQ